MRMIKKQHFTLAPLAVAAGVVAANNIAVMNLKFNAKTEQRR